MKKIFTLTLFLLYGLTFAQVGVNTTSPGSTLDVNGSLAAQYRPVTAATYAMNATDYYVSYRGTANATFTLPAAISGAGNFKGRLYTIKNNTSFTITVNPSGTETINGNSNLSIEANQSVQLINTGLTGTASTWEVLGYNTTSAAGTACVPDYVVADIPVIGQTITATGNDILFNNVLTSSGSVIPNTSGVFTLKAGTTYRLYSSLYGNFSNATSGTIYWDWVDATTNTKLVGATTGLLSPLSYSGTGSLQPVSEAIYTPATNQTIKVRVVALIGTVGLSAGSGYCRVIINQLNACSSGGGSGSSVTASNGLTAASNDVKLGGSLSAATTLTNNGNTLNIAGSASTTTFASNGNVGIGNTTPGSTLDVVGSLAANYKAVNANYTMTNTDFYIGYNGSTNGIMSLPVAISGNGNYKGRLYTIKNNTSSNTLTINAASGESINGSSSLTIPSGYSLDIINTGNTTGSTWDIVSYGPTSVNNGPSVAFSVVGAPSTQTVNGSTKISFGATEFNNGGGYDTTTSRFTAPVSGVYSFMVNGVSSGSHNVALYKNGAVLCYGSSTSGAGTSVVSRVTKLNAGDYIEVYDVPASGVLTWFAGVLNSSFSGTFVQ